MDEFTPITTPGTGTIDGHASATIGTGTEAGIQMHNGHEDYIDLDRNVIWCPDWEADTTSFTSDDTVSGDVVTSELE